MNPFDRLLWLGLAAVLTALLVPASRRQAACHHVPKRDTPNTTTMAAHLEDTAPPSGNMVDKPAESSPKLIDDVPHPPAGEEFVPQEEAGFVEQPEAGGETPEIPGPLLAPPR